MSIENHRYDVLVVGSGPAGQKAAVQAAKAGRKVGLIEQDRYLGGACVHRGTIPSKTLRENALRLSHLRRNAALASFRLNEDVEMATLIERLDSVVKAHDEYMQRQIRRNHIASIHGRAEFEDQHSLIVTAVNGERQRLRAQTIVIASGSYPRHPAHIPVDHEHIFDSDSILSVLYLPRSLTVVGSGVIACEYASIFQALGVQVTLIDRYPRPLGFLDADLTHKFVHAFTEMGGQWRGNVEVLKAQWDGLSQVVSFCSDGARISSEKLLCAAGRLANVKDLKIENAGLMLNSQGLLSVDSDMRTEVPHIFACGDVIGPPSLASTAMEQGRRASCSALDINIGNASDMIPSGIYSIPELSSVGFSEHQARDRFGDVIVGKALFEEIARGQISGIQDGMLKIVCDKAGKKILGVMIVGEGATELIHIGQMAMIHNADVDIFVESVFNFPTLAEAYRVAALAVIGQRGKESR